MTWTNKGKCLDLSGGNQADGNRVRFRLPSHTILNSLLVRLRFKYGLAAMVTPTKSGTLDTWSTTCPRPLRMASTALTTAVLALARHPSARLHGSSMDYRSLRPSEFSLTLSTKFTALQATSVCGHHVSYNPRLCAGMIH